MMRVRALIIIALMLGSSGAFAQTGCQGQPAAGATCGNPGATSGFPSWATMTALLDRNFGGPSTQGTILNRQSSVWVSTAAPTLGKTGTATGLIGLVGITSGSVTIGAPTSGANTTFTFPNSNGSNLFVLTTDGAGNTSWTNPAAGGTVTSVGLALPGIFAISGSPVTISGTLTGTLANQSANLVWAGPGTGAAAAPTFRSLVGADLPNPSASTLGGVQSFAAVGSQWIRQISTSGVATASQPAFTDISGVAAAAQLPNPTASTLGGVESLAAVASKWINTISTSGVPSATQPIFSDIGGNATLAQLASIGNGSIYSNISGGTATPLGNSLTSIIDSVIGNTQGQVLYRSGTVWTALNPGTAGQVLTTAGAAANPSWTSVSGTGTVTSIATNNGVTGGTITTSGTIGLASISTGNVLANTSGISAAPSATTPTSVLDVIGSTQGSVLYRGASVWTALTPGTNGQFLQTQGGGSTPQWASAVTSTGSFASGHVATFNGTTGNIIQDGGIPTTGVRQAILSGAVNSFGFPAFATIGSGLNVNLVATSAPLTLSFAAGFNAVAGPTDFVGQLAADTTSYWASLPANQYSFLSIDRNTSTGALTATQTLVRPQYGPVFYAPRQALLHFENNLTDDWGNPWTSSGATFTAGCAKFGSFGLSLSGTSSYAQTNSILNPGQGNWAIGAWVKLTSNTNAQIYSVGTAFGMFLGTNASGKLQLFLSSTGNSWDIAVGTGSALGSTTVTAGAFHHFAISFDGANYRVFIDGTIELTVANPASQSVSGTVWPEGSAMTVGSQSGSAGSTAGCWDEFEFWPYAKWVANFSLPVAASSVSGDWFDTNQMQMKTASGAGPTWSVIQRQYVAEAITGAATVSAVLDYVPTTTYRGGDFSVDNGNHVRIGNVLYYGSSSQFITNSTVVAAPQTWVLSPVTYAFPPNAKAIYVQATLHAAIDNNGGAGPANSDCSLNTRIPTGVVQNYSGLATAFANFSPLNVTNTTAFTEGIGPTTNLRIPIINGIASFESVISGTTCAHGGANAAKILGAVITAVELP